MTEQMIEDIEPIPTAAEKKASNKEMIKKIKKQNPGVKVKHVPGGGFQIVNPKAPSPLLTNLIKRLETK
jgi:hypothetical protein